MVKSYPLCMLALEPPRRHSAASAFACVLCRATQHEVQSNLHMAATVLGLEAPR